MLPAGHPILSTHIMYLTSLPLTAFILTQSVFVCSTLHASAAPPLPGSPPRVPGGAPARPGFPARVPVAGRVRPSRTAPGTVCLSGPGGMSVRPSARPSSVVHRLQLAAARPRFSRAFSSLRAARGARAPPAGVGAARPPAPRALCGGGCSQPGPREPGVTGPRRGDPLRPESGT